MVGMLKTTVRRMLKQANLGREWWSYACRFAGHMMRERALGREWTYPLFGQLVGVWKSHDKAQAKSLDDRGSVGYLLDSEAAKGATEQYNKRGLKCTFLLQECLRNIPSVLAGLGHQDPLHNAGWEQVLGWDVFSTGLCLCRPGGSSEGFGAATFQLWPRVSFLLACRCGALGQLPPRAQAEPSGLMPSGGTFALFCVRG